MKLPVQYRDVKQRSAFVLAAQRCEQRAETIGLFEKALDIGDEGTCHDDRVGGGFCIDRTIDGDDLT